MVVVPRIVPLTASICTHDHPSVDSRTSARWRMAKYRTFNILNCPGCRMILLTPTRPPSFSGSDEAVVLDLFIFLLVLEYEL